MLRRQFKLLSKRAAHLSPRDSALEMAYGKDMASSLDTDEIDLRAEWRRHIVHQKRRNWVFDDDDGDDAHHSLGGTGTSVAVPAGCDPTLNHKRFGQSCLYVPSEDVLSPDAMFDTVLSNYSASMYAYGLFEVVDIVECLLLSGLLPEASHNSRVGSAIETWFVSPATAWRHRGLMSHLMGPERWRLVDAMLQWMLREYDANGSPLKRASISVTRNDDWCTFLRCSVAFGLLSPDLAAFLPIVVEAAIKGTLVNYALPGDQRDRAFAIATLLLETSVEYGSLTLLDLALDVHRQFHMPTGYKVMLRVQQAFDKSGRRTKDWGLRSSGALEAAIPRWLREHYPVVLAPLANVLRSCEGANPHDADRCPGGASIPPAPLLTSTTSSTHGAKDTLSTGKGVASAEATVWSSAEIADLHRMTTQDLLQQGAAATLTSHLGMFASGSGTNEVTQTIGFLPPTAAPSAPLPSAGNGEAAALSAAGCVLYTDHIAPDVYFQSSLQRYGSTTEMLEDSILRQEKNRMALVRQGTSLFSCGSHTNGHGDAIVGADDNVGLPDSFQSSTSTMHRDPLSNIVLQQVLRTAERNIVRPEGRRVPNAPIA